MEPLKLPSSVISQTDVARLLRELNGLDDFFVGAKSRRPGTKMSLPKISRQIDLTARDNSLNLLAEADRQRMMAGLKTIHERAPNLHISFAIEPSPKAFEKIVLWLRSNIHPQALVSVGLQPTIAAGCVLRTTNRVFDMSLRASLAKQTDYLKQLVQGAVSGQ